MFQIGHCRGTVLRDPLSYVTFSFQSLEGSHMTVSTVYYILLTPASKYVLYIEYVSEIFRDIEIHVQSMNSYVNCP